MNKTRAALIRAGRTVAQSALGAIGGATAFGSVDWKVVGSSALLAGIVSLLTSASTDLPEAGEFEA